MLKQGLKNIFRPNLTDSQYIFINDHRNYKVISDIKIILNLNAVCVYCLLKHYLKITHLI